MTGTIAPHWRVLLFGGLQLRHGDRTIARFSTRKTGALLAYLAFHLEQPSAREVLAELLWPSAELDSQRNSLRVALNSLRKQLETPELPADLLVHTNRSAVWLHAAAFQSDVREFESALKEARRAPSESERRIALDRALSLYRGPLLEGWYEDWITFERDRLAALYESACAQRAALGSAPQQDTAEPTPTAHSALPTPLTRFFGRTDELATLAEQLASGARLISLVGTGGSGKTRLALEAARRFEAVHSQRVCFVPLADTTAPNLVATLAHACGLAASPELPLRTQLQQELGTEPTLLVLDNAEPLTEALADLLSELLPSLPQLQCLVTSRVRLELDGEQVFPLAPLAAAAALELFVDRAQAVRPDFQRTPRNQDALLSLVGRLEHWPLALELAATWAHLFSPTQMLEQLERRFEWLTTTRRNLPLRHRSLRAVLEETIAQLSPSAARALAGLSLFCGSWSLDAAASLLSLAPTEALQVHAELRRFSLLQTLADDDGALRYALQDTIRAFASEQLRPEARLALAPRFAQLYSERAQSARAAWDTSQHPQVCQSLEQERENLLQATRLALELHRLDDAQRLTVALWPYWLATGQCSVGRELVEAVLVHTTLPELYRGLGRLAAAEGELRVAHDALQCAIAGFEQAGDPLHAEQARQSLALLSGEPLPALATEPTANPLLTSYVELGLVSLVQGDLPAGRELLEEALQLSRELHDTAAEQLILAHLMESHATADSLAVAQWARRVSPSPRKAA